MKKVFSVTFIKNIHSHKILNILENTKVNKKERTQLDALLRSTMFESDITAGVNIQNEAVNSFEDLSKITRAIQVAKENKIQMEVKGNYKEFVEFKEEMVSYVKVLQKLEEELISAGIELL